MLQVDPATVGNTVKLKYNQTSNYILSMTQLKEKGFNHTEDNVD